MTFSGRAERGVRPQPAEDLHGHAVVLLSQPEQQVAGADVIAEPECLPQRDRSNIMTAAPGTRRS